MKKILIIGATGMLGKPVTEVLMNEGFEVSALVRNRARANKIFGGSSLEILEGDLKNETTLRTAMQGKDAIYLNLSVSPSEKPDDFHTETNGLKLLLRVAEDQRVKRVAYLSSLVGKYEHDWWVLKLKKEAVHILRTSRLKYTIFYPSNFMESIVGQYKSGNHLMILGKPQYPLHWISAKDYGKQVANAIRFDQGNKEYIIQGPEAIAVEDAFKIFIKNFKTKSGPLKIRKMPISLMKMAALFSDDLSYGVQITESINNYPEEFGAEETWTKLGKPTTTLDEFARQMSMKMMEEEALEIES